VVEGQRFYTVTLEKQGEPASDLRVTISPSPGTATGEHQVNCCYFTVMLHKLRETIQLEQTV